MKEGLQKIGLKIKEPSEGIEVDNILVKKGLLFGGKCGTKHKVLKHSPKIKCCVSREIRNDIIIFTFRELFGHISRSLEFSCHYSNK